MQPVIALVGRPNVGKSTLFNRLTRSRDALVADYPGLTRDRQYGRGVVGQYGYLVIDTGGMGEAAADVSAGMQAQARQALTEADVILLILDGRSGMTSGDETLAVELRRRGTPVIPVVNKIDGLDAAAAVAEFHGLGLGQPRGIAAAHGQGVEGLIDSVLDGVAGAPPQEHDDTDQAAAAIGVAVIGRPNVGKSTLVNRLLGEERVLVYDQPGTTRDSIFVPFERDGVAYTLIDTAGLRRRSRIEAAVEKYSMVKTMQALDAAHVAIVVLDAQEGITEQDAHLVGHVLEAGRALIFAINKWDGLEPAQKATVRRGLDIKLGFVDFARHHFISAYHGTGTGLLFDTVRRAHAAAVKELDTPTLNRLLQGAVEAHEPPLAKGRRVKLRYAHQGGRNPPTIVIHGNQTARLPAHYRRYLINCFRRALNLRGTPVRLDLRTGENPYAGRKNPPSARQKRHKQRLVRHVKKNKARR